MLSAAVDVIELGIDLRRHAALDAGAPVGEARHEQPLRIHNKRGNKRNMSEAAGIVEEQVAAGALACAAENAQVRAVVIDAHAGADLSFTSLVEQVRSRNPGR